jgi:hypothetical protein
MNTMTRCLMLFAATLRCRRPTIRLPAYGAARAAQPQILRELFDLVAIPNVAADKANISNAQASRGCSSGAFSAGHHRHVGLARRAGKRVPNVSRTLTFYFHYDGQPVEAREWTCGPPFVPIIVTDPMRGRAPDWIVSRRDRSELAGRRSSSDGKSPIIASLRHRGARRVQRGVDVERARHRRATKASSPSLSRWCARTATGFAATLILVTVRGTPTIARRCRRRGHDRHHHGLRPGPRSAQRQLRQLGPNRRCPRQAPGVDEDERAHHGRRVLRRCDAAHGG